MRLERTERHLPSEEGSGKGDHSGEGGECGLVGLQSGGTGKQKSRAPARVTRLRDGGWGLVNLGRGCPRMSP